MFICLVSLFSVSICDILPGTLDDRLGLTTFRNSLFCCLFVSTDLSSYDNVACLMVCVSTLSKGVTSETSLCLLLWLSAAKHDDG